MSAEEDPLEFVSIEEAAGELKTTVLNVLMHLRRKLLVGQEVDGSWQISRESLLHFRRDVQSMGVPELCGSSCAKKRGCGSCG